MTSFLFTHKALLSLGIFVWAVAHWMNSDWPGTTSTYDVSVASTATRAADEAVEQDDDSPKGEFEEIFVDWEDPEFCLFVSGRLHGYIEPCGCTGLANQKGGLLRRDALRRQLINDRKWDLVTIDSGNQIRRFGAQAFVKLQTVWDSLVGVMGYDAVAFGPDDLKTSGTDLLQAMSTAVVDEHPRFVGANIQWEADGFAVPYRIVTTKSRRKICVTAVVADEFEEEYSDDTFKFIRCDDALARVVPDIVRADCDINVIVVWATDTEECVRVAKKFPQFDVLISTAGGGEPTQQPEVIEAANGHLTHMIQTGVKGMYAGVVGFFPVDEGLRLQYQRVPLDHRFTDTEEMKEVFKAYQEQLEIYGLEGLGVNSVGLSDEREYVGSEACADCHEEAYSIWKDGPDGPGGEVGPHWRATLDLTEPSERVWVKRHYDPECISCHVTGWNPQEYFPYETGYQTLADAHLHGNGCENCHGPGSLHVAAENGDIDPRPEYVEQMILTLEEARKSQCFECHDHDNSPDFEFESYWEKIKHYED